MSFTARSGLRSIAGPTAALLLVTLAVACAEPDLEVTSAAVVVPAELVPQLEVSPGHVRVPAGVADALSVLRRGDVLVIAGDPTSGDDVIAALRRIDAVAVGPGGELELATRPASIGDVVEDAEVAASFAVAPPAASDGDPRYLGRDLGGIDVGVGRVRMSPGNDDVRVELLEARVRARPDLDLDLAVVDGRVERFGASISGELEASLTIAVDMDRGATRFFELPLAKRKRFFVQSVGPIPVVWSAEVVIGVGVELHATTAARFELGGTLSTQLSGGAAWTPAGWTTHGDARFEVTPTGAGLTNGGTYDVRAYAFAKVDVQLYDAAGPYFTVRPYLAERRQPDQATVRAAGVQGVFGAELAVPVFDLSLAAYEVTLFNPTRALADASPAACGELDYLGVCTAGVARWCSDGVVREVDCAASARGCGWVDDTVGYFCTAGCGELDYAGSCAGDDVRWCEDGAVHHVACADGCGWVSEDAWYACR